MSATTASQARRWPFRSTRRSASGEQRGCDTGPTVLTRDVNLFDIVVDNHHEPGDGVPDGRDHCLLDSLPSSRFERLASPSRDQLVRDASLVPSRHPSCQIRAIGHASACRAGRNAIIPFPAATGRVPAFVIDRARPP